MLPRTGTISKEPTFQFHLRISKRIRIHLTVLQKTDPATVVSPFALLLTFFKLDLFYLWHALLAFYMPFVFTQCLSVGIKVGIFKAPRIRLEIGEKPAS